MTDKKSDDKSSLTPLAMSSNIAMKRVWVIGRRVVYLAMFVLVTAVSVFFYGERQREQLLSSYAIPAELLKIIQSFEHAPVTGLMEGHEVMVCAINSYGTVEVLSSLNDKQKASLPKSRLPSEDMTWYLLFLANDTVSRIYLIDTNVLEGGLSNGSAGCIGRGGSIVVRKMHRPNGETYSVLQLID